MAWKIERVHYLAGIGIFLTLMIAVAVFSARKNVVQKAECQEEDMIENIAVANIELISLFLYSYEAKLMHIDHNIKDFGEHLVSKELATMIANDSCVVALDFEKRDIKKLTYVISPVADGEKKILTVFYPLKNKEGFVFSMKLDLLELHDRIALKYKGALVYVSISLNGVYIYHPDEKLIGKKVGDRNLAYQEKGLKTKRRVLRNVYSEYLGIDVYRFFIEKNFKGGRHVFSASLPRFRITELVNRTEQAFLQVALIAILSLFVVLLLGVLVWRNESRKRQKTEKEKLKLKIKAEKQARMSIATELQVLKSGLAPHFLFNSLSSLKILVHKNPKVAQEFVVSLSNVYRYMLRFEKQDRISLKEEMMFAKDYIKLKKIRFGEAIKCEIDISEKLFDRLLPPVSIQMLVDNCIKHTIVSEKNPLFIHIYGKNDYIVVQNNYNPRMSKQEYSGLGLRNLKKRYAFFTSKNCFFYRQHDHFFAKIPLLDVE